MSTLPGKEESGTAAETTVHERGYWCHADESGHCYDDRLAGALAAFFLTEGAVKVADLGCGPGYYTSRLLQAGLDCEGYDGNPHTSELSHGECRVLDLTLPGALSGRTYEWGLCLEVGEHIPRALEEDFLNNITEACRHGLVLSWAVPGQDGIGHVNCHTNAVVTGLLGRRGFQPDPAATAVLRGAVSGDTWWFRKTLMVFRRRPPRRSAA